jgi:CDGSH-type Zn-finger protein
LSTEVILNDNEGNPLRWGKGKSFEVGVEYALCRCGSSKNKPFCDTTHVKVKFNGAETASRKPYREQAESVRGPGLILKDCQSLCAGAGFCHRKSGTWNLTENSGDPECRKTAIQQACNCPSGRLVACDKDANEDIEPKFTPSIALVEDPDNGLSGPIWLRGGVQLESSDGKPYEIRNRITVCRCGKSGNKPFCDGTHIDIRFSDKK